MHHAILLTLLGLMGFALPLPAQIFLDDLQTTTQASFTGTVNNLGSLGNHYNNDWDLGQAGWQSPIGSGTEHIYYSGLWVGALKNGTPQVSTGAADMATPSFTDVGWEFTSRDSLQLRSSDPQSSNFHPDACAEQEILAHFSDTSLTWNGVILQDHSPIGLDIRMKCQIHHENASQPQLANMALLTFSVTNISGGPLDSIYVGYWIDAVIRNTNVSPPGSPSYFFTGGNGYVDSLDLAYEFDHSGDTAFTDSYLGLTYLGGLTNGSIPSSPNFSAQFNSWQFNNIADPIFFAPMDDFSKYQKMSSGLENFPMWPLSLEPQLNNPANRSILVTAGPFGTLANGDSLEATFAVIVAPQLEDGQGNFANTVAQRDSLVRSTWNARNWYANNNCLSTSRAETEQLSLKVFPNPSQGRLLVAVNRPLAKETEIQVVDLQGRVIRQLPFQGQQMEIPDLPPGIFLVNVYRKGNLLAREKVVVLR